MDKLLRLTDCIFGMFIVLGLSAFLYLPQIDVRWVVIPGVYAPEAYKIVVYSVFSMLVLRKFFGRSYGLALIMVYTLAEVLGNTTYILLNWSYFIPRFQANFFEPIASQDPLFTYKLIVFYSIALISYLMMRKKFTLKLSEFWPLVALISILIGIGYPSNMTTVPQPPYPYVIVFIAEASWMILYLVGWTRGLAKRSSNLWGIQASILSTKM
jgi:hypothetical protein